MSTTAILSELELQAQAEELESQLAESREDRQERESRLRALHDRIHKAKDELAHKEMIQRRERSIEQLEAGIARERHSIEHVEAQATAALDAYVAAVDSRAAFAVGYVAPEQYEKALQRASFEFVQTRSHLWRRRNSLSKLIAQLEEGRRFRAQIPDAE